MNRAEFMEQLERLLCDIPEYERLDALAYYNDYFDDAGPENEGEVIRKLGSPAKVAAIIKTNLDQGQEHGEFTEYGYRETEEEETIQPPAAHAKDSSREKKQHSRTYHRSEENEGTDRERDSTAYTARRRGTAGWTLLIIGLVFASPLILGIGGGIIGAFFGILAGLIGLVISILGAGIGLFLGGIIAIGKGIFTCFGAPAVGIMTMGLGFLSAGIGIVCLLLFSMVLRLIPGFVRWVKNLISRIFHRRQGGMQQ